MINEVIYPGRDNALWVGLRINHKLVDISQIRKVELVFKHTVFSSDVLNNAAETIFDWSQAEGLGVLVIRAGVFTLTKGTYIAKLVIYTQNNLDGLVWDYLKLQVR